MRGDDAVLQTQGKPGVEALSFDPASASASAKTLAANVRRLRKEKGLSQSEVARSLGVDQVAVSLIELKRSNPTMRLLDAIAELLGVSSAELLSKASGALQKGADFAAAPVPARGLPAVRCGSPSRIGCDQNQRRNVGWMSVSQEPQLRSLASNGRTLRPVLRRKTILSN